MNIGAAREKVRVARQLGGLPEVDQAFSTGGLSYSKVRAITRVATPENEGFMVIMAEQASACHLEKLVGKSKPVDESSFEFENSGAQVGSGDALGDTMVSAANDNSQQDTADASSGNVGDTCDRETNIEEQREQARELYWFQNEDGMWIIHAKLPPEQVQLAMKALEAFARPLQEGRLEAGAESTTAGCGAGDFPEASWG